MPCHPQKQGSPQTRGGDYRLEHNPEKRMMPRNAFTILAPVVQLQWHLRVTLGDRRHDDVSMFR